MRRGAQNLLAYLLKHLEENDWAMLKSGLAKTCRCKVAEAGQKEWQR
jgi:hypothetical protein